MKFDVMLRRVAASAVATAGGVAIAEGVQRSPLQRDLRTNLLTNGVDSGDRRGDSSFILRVALGAGVAVGVAAAGAALLRGRGGAAHSILTPAFMPAALGGWGALSYLHSKDRGFVRVD